MEKKSWQQNSAVTIAAGTFHSPRVSRRRGETEPLATSQAELESQAQERARISAENSDPIRRNVSQLRQKPVRVRQISRRTPAMPALALKIGMCSALSSHTNRSRSPSWKSHSRSPSGSPTVPSVCFAAPTQAMQPTPPEPQLQPILEHTSQPEEGGNPVAANVLSGALMSISVRDQVFSGDKLNEKLSNLQELINQHHSDLCSAVDELISLTNC